MWKPLKEIPDAKDALLCSAVIQPRRWSKMVLGPSVAPTPALPRLGRPTVIEQRVIEKLAECMDHGSRARVRPDSLLTIAESK